MTKFTLPQVYDTSEVASTKSFTDLTKFFDFFNRYVSNVGRALTNGISVADNLDAEVRTVDMTHAVTLAMTLKKRPIGIQVTRVTFDVMPSATPMVSFQWWIANDGSISAQAKYDTGTSATVGQVTLFITYS